MRFQTLKPCYTDISKFYTGLIDCDAQENTFKVVLPAPGPDFNGRRKL